MSLNLSKQNFEPFINNIFNTAKISTNNPQFFETCFSSLPTLPSIYFKQPDIYGSNIINDYYKLKILFNRLDKIKNTIKFVLETSKDELSKILINLNKYEIIGKQNIIFKITDNYTSDFNTNFNTTTNFENFRQKFIAQKYNLFENIDYTENSILFYYIFNHEYKINKKYFLKLFNEYIKIRKEILEMINSNYGLLAFESVFELDKNVDLTKKNKNLNKNEINKKNEINYNKYKYQDENINNLKNIKGLNINNNNISKGNKYTKIPYMINEYNSLYTTNIHKSENLKLDHKKRLLNLFKNVHQSLNYIITNSSNINLYDFINNNIEYDYNILEFIFYFVKPELFNNFIDNNQKIKNYIYKKIGVFDTYYDLYIEWWKRLISGKPSATKLGIGNELNFKVFFEHILDEITK
jgi:hypothetical protein